MEKEVQSGHDLTENYFNKCQQGLRKTTNTSLTQDTYSPSQNFNPGPPKYKAEVLLFSHTSTGNNHVTNSEMKNLIKQAHLTIW